MTLNRFLTATIFCIVLACPFIATATINDIHCKYTTDDTPRPNYPCSQSKREVAYCQADIFICNNGSVSASKRDCRTDCLDIYHDKNLDKAELMQPAQGGTACSCRQGLFCIDKKGKYCLDNSNKESYLPDHYQTENSKSTDFPKPTQLQPCRNTAQNTWQQLLSWFHAYVLR